VWVSTLAQTISESPNAASSAEMSVPGMMQTWPSQTQHSLDNFHMRIHRQTSFQAHSSRNCVHLLATLHHHPTDTYLVVLTGPTPLAASPLLAGLAVIGCAAFAPPASAAASHCLVLPALAVRG